MRSVSCGQASEEQKRLLNAPQRPQRFFYVFSTHLNAFSTLLNAPQRLLNVAPGAPKQVCLAAQHRADSIPASRSTGSTSRRHQQASSMPHLYFSPSGVLVTRWVHFLSRAGECCPPFLVCRECNTNTQGRQGAAQRLVQQRARARARGGAPLRFRPPECKGAHHEAGERRLPGGAQP